MFARLLRRTGLAVSLLLIGLSAQAQFTGTINTYARITGIAANSPVAGQTTLTVDNIGGASAAIGQFATAGSVAHIFQMRGATVDVASTTSATHGAITAYNNAGNNEQVGVISATGSTIVVDRLLRRSYTVGEGLQIVHVPVSTAATATITGNVTAPAWNPTTSTGGVIMLIAQNTLEVGADVNANGLGFALGAESTNSGLGAGCTANTTYALDHPSQVGAQKGSSIAPLVATEDGGRGRWASGGGGGNRNNGGGGGGGNYTAGGTGGNGVAGEAGCDLPAEGGRGIGGDALDYTTGRLFLGGGGGGGHGDSGLGTDGAAGGGIIIIAAGTLTVTGTRTISANGNAGITTTPGGTNDGAGGGGAGGVVILEISTFSLPTNPPTCTGGSLTVSVNGGNGGTSSGTSATTRGGGGGGGAGYLGVTNLAYTGQCITFLSNPGVNGASCIAPGMGCPTTIGSGPGTLPPGCTVTPCTTPVGPVVSPLPIVLTSLSAQRQGPDVLLAWSTASELNNSHFVVERSGDGQNYSFLTTVPGNGTTQRAQRYAHVDREAPTGDLYYRLLQLDFDGTQTIYGPIRVMAESGEPALRVVQNPVRAGQPVAVEVSGSAGRRLELVDLSGRILAYQWISALGTTLVPLYAHDLTTGLYIVRLQGTRLSARVVVE